MSDTIELGDVVRLRSGGPKMTVVEFVEPTTIIGGRLVHCLWFVETDQGWQPGDSIDVPAAAIEKVEG